MRDAEAEPPRWQTFAACRGMDPSLFFVADPGNTNQYDVARSVCGPCPVRDVCLQEGMREKFGMWGGSTEQDRRRLRRQRIRDRAAGVVSLFDPGD